MTHVTFDFDRALGPVRPMHCVNNGPVCARGDQTRGNAEAYRALSIPYARNHDAAFDSDYGGEHSVDISAVFPRFEADPEDPASYDFVCTDEYVRATLSEGGTETFYRLGQKIEHYIKKFSTVPPADFRKWAVVCEHVIRHYNEGWAGGFRWNLTYWEIWNEPDLDPDDSANKRCWGGTAAEFYELYAVTAKHLKACFPGLKIGGPALAGQTGAWMDGFLQRLTREDPRVPLDFFSWHIYATEPQQILDRASVVREKLDRAGYTETESILNEWNYVRDWSAGFLYSVLQIIGIKGAAFTAAVMCAAHRSSIDMLMYYDARPTVFNGLFDYYTLRPLKGYYPFLMFSRLYGLGTAAFSDTDSPEVYALCAAGSGRKAAMIARYSDANDQAGPLPVQVRLPDGEWTVSVLDRDRTMEKRTVIAKNGGFVTEMEPYSVLFLEKGGE